VLYRPLGPGSVQKSTATGSAGIIGGIAPHAGYVYCGMVAAHLYSVGRRTVSPNRSSYSAPTIPAWLGLAITTQDFVDPLGVAKVDLDLGETASEGLGDDDPASHSAGALDRGPAARSSSSCPTTSSFVPICMGFQISRRPRQLATRFGRDEVRRTCRHRFDRLLATTCLRALPEEGQHGVGRDQAMNRKALYEVVRDEDISMCGYGPRG